MPRWFARWRRVLAIPFALLVAGCGGASPRGQGAPGGPGAFPPAEVTVVTLAPAPIPQSSDYIATIRSLNSTTVQPQVEGVVRTIFVKAGDRVQVGQPIAQIDPEKQQASVTAVESQRLSREADVAFAGQHLARLQKLFDAGAVSRAELEQAETAAKTARAQLDALGSQLQESRVELEYYRITAAADGTVGEIATRVGDRVTKSTAITTIDQSQGLEAYVNVPLERAPGLRLGLAMELLDGEGRVIASNPITFVAPRADEAMQSVLVKATLRGMPAHVRVMQFVRARIIWSTEPRLTVPVVAVSRVGAQYFVFVAMPGEQGTVARQRPITVGELVKDSYVVSAGLAAGDRVIVSNVQKLGDGAPVKAS